MELIKLDLISKNNIKNGFYLYVPIVKVENKYFWCESIKSKNTLKTDKVSITELKITKEIPEIFYKANGIN